MFRNTKAVALAMDVLGCSQAGMIACACLSILVSEAKAEESRASASGDSLEEVVVTAQKREERLIDTPQSVSVLSSDALAKIGATQFRDFADTVAGLSQQTTGAGLTQVTLRGVTTGFDIGPSVGIYVDEVPYGSSSAFALGAQQALDVGLFDVDRIEVLRGPQGTLYGASTMGGLIKYVSKTPDAKTFGVDAQVGSAGTQHGGVSYNGAVAVNAPIVDDKAAIRLSGFYSRDGGFIDNAALGQEDVNTSNIYGGRADIALTPTDALAIRFGAFAQNISRDGQSTIEYTATGVPQYGSLKQFRGSEEQSDQRFRLVSGTISYGFGLGTLTSVSSYQTAESENYWDISAVYVPLLQGFLERSYGSVGYPFNTTTNKFTQEVRLASDVVGPIEWVIGGFYTHETSRYAEEFVPRDLFGNEALNDLYDFVGSSIYDEYAGFGDVTWHLNDKLSVTGGVRYARNDQEYDQYGAGRFISSRPKASSDEGVSTYLANARYKFSDHSTGYVRYATGYRPGGPNASANDPVTGQPLGSPTFDADKLKSYEIGYKAETGDRRFGVDLSAYYIDWSNIQILVVRGGFALRDNASSDASIKGAEIALTARPVRELTVSAAFAYQDAKLSDADPDLGAAAGERLPNVPKFTGSMNVDYQLPIQTIESSVGASVRHIDERSAGFGNAAYQLPEYTTADVRAGLGFAAVSMQLYVRNVFDKQGQISAMLPQFGTRIAIQQPRTFGANLTTRF